MAVAGKLVLLLQQFLLVPLFLTAWGVDYYGAWLVISAVPSMLMLSNMSVGTAASVRIALELGQEREKQAGNTLATAVAFIFFVCSLLVGVAAMLPDAFFRWLSVGQIETPSLVLSALMAGFGVMALSGPLEGLWNARKKAAMSLLFRTAIEAACLVGATIALLVKADALVFAVTMLVIRIIGSTAYLFASWRLLRPAAIPTPRISCAMPLLQKGMGFQIGALWPALYFQGSILIANWLLGASGAAAWGTLRTLTRFGNQAPMVTFQALYPEMQLSLGKSDVQGARRLNSVALVLSVLVGCGLACGLIFLGGPVYSFWTQGKFEIPQLVWLLMAAGLLLNSIWYTCQMVPFASNRPWGLSLLLFGGAVLSVSVMALATIYTHSLVGMAVGALMFELFCAVGVAKLSVSLLNDSIRDTVSRGWKLAWSRQWLQPAGL